VNQRSIRWAGTMNRRKPMKRTSLKRGAPLARGPGLTRSPMKKGKSKRAQKSGGHLFPANVDKAFRAWVREQPCVVTGYATGGWSAILGRAVRVVCAHLKSRGSGGKDAENIVPLDWQLHDELGQRGRSEFELRYRVSLPHAAAIIWARYQRETGTP